MTEDRNGIGDRVRNARKRRGLSQQELAELSGVSVSLIRKLEQGERTDVRMETLRRLAVALEVPTTALMGRPPPDARGTAATALWTPAREAILRPQQRNIAEPVTERELTGVMLAAVKLYHDNCRCGDGCCYGGLRPRYGTTAPMRRPT